MTILQDRNATVAEAKIFTGGKVIEATGAAKRNKEEKFDSVSGNRIATGRALRALGRIMEESVR